MVQNTPTTHAPPPPKCPYGTKHNPYTSNCERPTTSPRCPYGTILTLASVRDLLLLPLQDLLFMKPQHLKWSSWSMIPTSLRICPIIPNSSASITREKTKSNVGLVHGRAWEKELFQSKQNHSTAAITVLSVHHYEVP